LISRDRNNEKESPSLTDREVAGALQARLEAAKSAKAPWFETARILVAALDAARDESEGDALRAAAGRATGLSPQMLKRYVALLERMRTIAAEMGLSPDDLLSPVFNAQETAARIYARSPGEGADVMRRLAAGDITLARVRELQSRLAGPGAAHMSSRSAVRHARTVNAGLVERAFKDSLVELWGAGARLGRRPRLRYLGGSAGYEVVGGDGSVVAGIDVMFPDARLNRDYVEDNVGSSLLLSTFFAEFFLAFPPDADPDAISRTVELLEWFGCGWIGLTTCDGDGRLVVTRKPSGRPVPDRTARFDALKRKYRAARGTVSEDE
jgi:hypothetical protein